MTDYEVVIINNLSGAKKTINQNIAEEISDLIKINFKESNTGEYSEQEINYLISKKTIESIYKDLENGLLVYIKNKKNIIIAVGFVIKKDGKYEAKRLNVKNEYKRQGLGKIICEIREDELRKLGIKECYIESLKFKNTVRFHKSRGFKEVKSDKILKRTIYMKKDLF